MTEPAPRPLSPAYPTLESLAGLAARWNESAPMRHLGARLAFTRVDRVRAVIDPVLDVHRGGMGTDAVNGVVLAGLFDLAIGLVGWIARPDAASATVSLSMSFLRLTRGDRLEAEAWLVQDARHLVFAAAEIRDERGEVTARCDGISAIVPGARDAGGPERGAGRIPS